ncbi:MAG TPA: insulinase family protein, partial [Catalimonadaceae bacterium]|nr:insulinase family protein [Catalimonadaceae bacterium]
KLPPIKEEIPASKTIYLVNVPKAAQTEFRIGYSSNMVYDATGEYYRCGILNYPLGGAFNSRLNLNLREDKGWTYGARSGFGSNDYTGNFTFSAGIKAGATDSALVEINKEINGYFQNGITQEELKFLKSAIGQSDARKYESLNQKARFIGNILDHNLQPDFVKQQSKILQGIAAEEVNLLAKKWLNPEKMRIVLAGDKERISPGLERIGYKIVEISPEGEPIGK